MNKHCEFCDYNAPVMSHMEESTPENPKYCCVNCRNNIGLYIMNFMFTIEEGQRVLKLFKEHDKVFATYKTMIKKVSSKLNKPHNYIIDKLKGEEQELSVTLYNCYREVMLQDYEKHINIMNMLMKQYNNVHEDIKDVSTKEVDSNDEYLVKNYYKDYNKY